MFDNLIDSLYYSLDIKLLAMLKEIKIPSGDIFGPRNNKNNLQEDKNFLGDGL